MAAKRFAAFVAALAFMLTAMLSIASSANAAPADRGATVLAIAQTRAGDWYSYGSAGPTTFDCSGLVYWASSQAGIPLPRTTYGMLGSYHLVRTYNPTVGDLAFFGSGHVEIFAHGHDMTFGAQNSGTRVGMHQWNGWWHPTAFYKIE